MGDKLYRYTLEFSHLGGYHERDKQAELDRDLGVAVREALCVYSATRILPYKLLREYADHVRFEMAQAVLLAIADQLEREAT